MMIPFIPFKIKFSLTTVPVVVYSDKWDWRWVEGSEGQPIREYFHPSVIETTVKVDFDIDIGWGDTSNVPSTAEAQRKTAARIEIAAEVPVELAKNPTTEFEFTVYDSKSGEEFWLSRKDGTLVKLYIVRGEDAVAQSLYPARPGFRWFGIVSDEVQWADLGPSLAPETVVFRLRFAQRNRRTPLSLTTRAAVIVRDEMSGSDLGGGVTSVVSASTPNPSISSVVSTKLVSGGHSVAIAGKNFQPGAAVWIGNQAAKTEYKSDTSVVAAIDTAAQQDVKVLVVNPPELGGKGAYLWHTLSRG